MTINIKGMKIFSTGLDATPFTKRIDPIEIIVMNSIPLVVSNRLPVIIPI